MKKIYNKIKERHYFLTNVQEFYNVNSTFCWKWSGTSGKAYLNPIPMMVNSLQMDMVMIIQKDRGNTAPPFDSEYIKNLSSLNDIIPIPFNDNLNWVGANEIYTNLKNEITLLLKKWFKLENETLEMPDTFRELIYWEYYSFEYDHTFKNSCSIFGKQYYGSLCLIILNNMVKIYWHKKRRTSAEIQYIKIISELFAALFETEMTKKWRETTPKFPYSFKEFCNLPEVKQYENSSIYSDSIVYELFDKLFPNLN